MTSYTLKQKLIALPLFIVVLVMAASTIVASIVINRQNKTAAYERIETSLNVMRLDLDAIGAKLLENTVMMAGMELGSRLNYLMDMGDEIPEHDSTLPTMTQQLAQVRATGSMWKLAVYSKKGELYGFSALQPSGEDLVGYVIKQSEGTVRGTVLTEEKTVTSDSFKELASFEDEKLKSKFEGDVPQKEIVFFEEIDNKICLTAYAPALWAIEICRSDCRAAVHQNSGQKYMADNQALVPCVFGLPACGCPVLPHVCQIFEQSDS